jgi:hypothetical protein
VRSFKFEITMPVNTNRNVVQVSHDAASGIQLYPRTLRSYVNTMPPEILIDNFELCQSTDGHMKSQIPTLECIATVCSQWRAIALALPHLWS